ncbi:Rap family tetratricopeptide repeat protein [Bacillus sp. FSL K6-1000]|uniref:Rap family tetratricopeptide repeat protein n=1 Tax=Bacillus sp. FSL K6-1000 TaxID=2921458 RepID=UPI003159ACC6
MAKIIPSSDIGVKINKWYELIRRFDSEQAEQLKQEIRTSLDSMEEDQNLLLYFSLMEFRHEVMLDYLKPLKEGKLRANFSELSKEIDEHQTHVTGMLEYYYHFFRGMYEFGRREYIAAISSYQKAEHKLSFVSDDIERAEFHFKMSEIYYHMKQTHISMHHAKLALDVYVQHELYALRTIQCQFIVAGNYDDMRRHEKALPHLERALARSREFQNVRFIASSLFNMGNSYYRMGDLGRALELMKESISLFDQNQSDHLRRSIDPLYTAAQILYKQGKHEEALHYREECMKRAEALQDDIHIQKTIFLEALYLRQDAEHMKQIFHFLESAYAYPDIEELALDTAKYYNEMGDYEKSSIFYGEAEHARIYIQRGDCLYEF